MNNRDKFDPQVGDIVRIREWDDMVAEFGLNDAGNIPCKFTFIQDMKKLCGRTFKLTKIDSYGVCYGLDTSFSISKDMIELAEDSSPWEEVDGSMIDEFLGTIKLV